MVSRVSGLWGGLFLVGIGVIFLLHLDWYYIIMLVGVLNVVIPLIRVATGEATLASVRGWVVWGGLLLIMISVAFIYGFHWSYILIIIGLLIVVSTLLKR